MNYLAHIYLSNNRPPLQIGNFIADAVKGKNYLNYPQEIQEGILLHRKIDSFTDSHPIVKETKKVFSAYGHYSGVILDIVFDHFLAKNWSQYHTTDLETFVSDFYQLLDQEFALLPQRVQQFYPVMTQYNWLVKYATIGGISSILYQMNIRTRNISKMNYAVIELIENYEYLETQFKLFFEELTAFVNS